MLSFFWISGCSASITLGEPITEFGEYSFASGVKIGVVDNRGIVKYTLVDDKGNKLIESTDRASIFQKWMLVWDGSRLWFSSSDIGSIVWIKGDNGKYISTEFYQNSKLLGKAPDSIKQFIQ